MDTMQDIIDEAWYEMFGLDFKKWKETHPNETKEDFEDELEWARQEEWGRLTDIWGD